MWRLAQILIALLPLQVAVQAEVYSNNLSLQRRVMEELLQHLFSTYSTSLNEKLPSEKHSIHLFSE